MILQQQLNLGLCKDYDLKDIWNMDETGCFFNAQQKGLAKRGMRAQGGGGGRSQIKELRLFREC